MESPKRVYRKKLVLLVLIALTTAVPVAFVRYDDPDFQLNIMKGLAKAGSLAGAAVLFWQFLLGFRGALAALMPDHAWQVEVHKSLGQYGSYLILMHPIFITAYYLVRYGRNLYAFTFTTSFDLFVILGILVLAILVYLVLSSVFLRGKFSFDGWFFTHLSSYVLFPVMLVHSFAIGPTVRETGLRFIWYGLAAVAAVHFLFRLAHALGTFSRRYTVVRAVEVAVETAEITMQPADGGFRPGVGDFIYVRRRVRERSHPYTVSRYDEQDRSMTITVKALGPTSRELQDIRPGSRLLVDGTYGVFANEVYFTDDPVVIVAGGIGITPFLRVVDHLESRPRRESWLFYGNERLQNIAYKDYLDALRHTRVVHVLENEPDYPGETGFIDTDLMSRYLRQELAAYRYFICGPPPMLINIRRQLEQARVSPERIHYELFTE